MLYQSHNPYSVLFETISFDNVQKMGELITLKTLRGSCSYSKCAATLYFRYVNDLNRRNNVNYVLSDAYDLAQMAICFLYEFIGKKLDDVYKVKKGKIITIRKATYNLVSNEVTKLYLKSIRYLNLQCREAQKLSVELSAYQEQDFSGIDNKIERLKLKQREQVVLDCYMGGMCCNEIADFLDIDRTTVWRRRQRIQIQYKALF